MLKLDPVRRHVEMRDAAAEFAAPMPFHLSQN
jgi:hypothetical protein